MLYKKDFLWLLAFPIYQIIGTVRHEGSHALMAIFEGAKIHEFVYLPTLDEQMGFLWGYVKFSGPTSWLTYAAPYFCDLLTFALFFGICLKVRFSRRWAWLNLFILGMLSPFLNSLYAYIGGFFRPHNDVAMLFYSLPGYVIHLYFIISIFLYVIGLIVVFKYSNVAKNYG